MRQRYRRDIGIIKAPGGPDGHAWSMNARLLASVLSGRRPPLALLVLLCERSRVRTAYKAGGRYGERCASNASRELAVHS